MDSKTTRSLIVEKTDQLFYQQGFDYTSFAHIADAVGISRGNLYHHFKTKDEILSAVISYRLANTQALLGEWELAATPQDRIRKFINILVMNKEKIKRYGCPVGTLCAELTKLDHSSRSEANKLFTLFRVWLSKQFVMLGQKAKSDELALHLLARSQGIATLASAFQDEKFIKQEVGCLNEWLNSFCESTTKT
jgi:TetR/AcrR family transcriptional repressor of nem operon